MPKPCPATPLSTAVDLVLLLGHVRSLGKVKMTGNMLKTRNEGAWKGQVRSETVPYVITLYQYHAE